MRLVALRLVNFRNYATAELSPGPLNLIVGPNAQGKTNLLEAILFLGTARSHRAASAAEAIRSGADQALIEGEVHSANTVRRIRLVLERNGRKQIQVDGKPLPRLSALLGVFRVVLFAPESTAIVRGGPSERRRFLDLLASQVRADYLAALQEYTAALRQRNELLKRLRLRGDGEEVLDAWDAVLSRSGAALTRLRAALCVELGPRVAQAHHYLTDGRERLTLTYLPSAPDDPEEYRERLIALRATDRERATTSLGPHRDEIALALNDADARRFASQGQQRTATLALKLAEIGWIQQRTGEPPVVLLDDVASELDPARTELLLQTLEKIPSQVFLTATHLDELATIGGTSRSLFEVRAGTVKPLIGP